MIRYEEKTHFGVEKIQKTLLEEGRRTFGRGVEQAYIFV